MASRGKAAPGLRAHALWSLARQRPQGRALVVPWLLPRSCRLMDPPTVFRAPWFAECGWGSCARTLTRHAFRLGPTSLPSSPHREPCFQHAPRFPSQPPGIPWPKGGPGSRVRGREAVEGERGTLGPCGRVCHVAQRCAQGSLARHHWGPGRRPVCGGLGRDGVTGARQLWGFDGS